MGSLSHAESCIGLLEVLNRSGQVTQRIAVGPGRITVGRALDNDVILDDPYVCPHHLALSVDSGQVTLEDLDSVNGTWLRGGRKPVTRQVLQGGEPVQLGHSTVRFRASGTAVPPARPDATARGWLSWFRKPLFLPLALLTAIAALVYAGWLEETRSLNLGIILNGLAYPMVGLLLWSGLWAGVNRVVSHQARFTAHLTIAALALGALYLGEEICASLAFAFDWHDAAPLLLLLTEVTVLGVALFAHLQYVGQGRTWLQLAGAAFLSATLVGSPALGDWLRRDDFNSAPLLNPLFKPPGLRVVEGASVEEFLGRAERLREDGETRD